MKKILILLGLADVESPKQQSYGPRIQSTYEPKHRISEQEWYKEFRVSMLYNRNPTYFG
jgi:hypothetical protein